MISKSYTKLNIFRYFQKIHYFPIYLYNNNNTIEKSTDKVEKYDKYLPESILKLIDKKFDEIIKPISGNHDQQKFFESKFLYTVFHSIINKNDEWIISQKKDLKSSMEYIIKKASKKILEDHFNKANLIQSIKFLLIYEELYIKSGIITNGNNNNNIFGLLMNSHDQFEIQDLITITKYHSQNLPYFPKGELIRCSNDILVIYSMALMNNYHMFFKYLKSHNYNPNQQEKQSFGNVMHMIETFSYNITHVSTSIKQLIDQFYINLTKYTSIINFDIHISLDILKSLWYFSVKQMVILNHFTELINYCILNISNNYQNTNILPKDILYYSSKVAHFLFLGTYINYCKMIGDIIVSQKYTQEEFYIRQYPYFPGICSLSMPQLDQVMKERCKITNLKKLMNFGNIKNFIGFFKSVILFACNGNCYTPAELDEYIKFGLENLKMFDKQSPYYNERDIFKISMSLFKIFYFSQDYWKAFFIYLTNVFSSMHPSSYHEVITIIYSFEIIYNSNESNKFKDILKIYLDWKTSNHELYEKIINLKIGKYARIIEPVSSINEEVKRALIILNLKFEAEALIHNFVVDFKLEEHKIIIEAMGPTHYIKPEMKELNQVTKFKIKMLEYSGYTIIIIPFDSIEKHQSEQIKYLHDQLKQLKIIK